MKAFPLPVFIAYALETLCLLPMARLLRFSRRGKPEGNRIDTAKEVSLQPPTRTMPSISLFVEEDEPDIGRTP